MDKKTNFAQEAEALTEKLAAVGPLVEPDEAREPRKMRIEPSRAARNVNLIIHEWLTDIWMLTTGEAVEDDGLTSSNTHHGRPVALVSDGQMRLLGNRVDALEALREVGIEMS